MSQLYKDHVATMLDPPHYVTFNRWNTIGSKFIALAAGGSFYILVLIAGLDMRYKIATIGSRIPWEVAKMLRSPETSSMSYLAYFPCCFIVLADTPSLILERIIPTIAWIRLHLPISFENIFCPSLLANAGLKESLDCTDFSATDRVLDGFKQKCVPMFL